MFENLAELHPIFVHFPIVLFLAYFIVECLNLYYKENIIDAINFIILIAGVLFSVVVVMTGNQAKAVALPLMNSKPAEVKEILELHETAATFSLWLFTGIFFLRYYLYSKRKLSMRWKIFITIIAFIGIVTIFETGLLGGKLVYEYGVGTKFFTK
ncbi:MAG: DUF2231 domain-containing protein [Ignavibacteriales bacterium]|nr:DUF2231 domain-containing protein [Ignavibacteriales bacterium]